MHLSPLRKRERASRAALLSATLLFSSATSGRGLPSDHVGVAAAVSCPASEELAFAETTANETFFETQQSVTALATGGFGVVWVEGTYPQHKVRMQWLDDNGRALFPPGGRLVAGGPVEHFPAVIAPDAKAGAYVAFVAGQDLVVQRFDAAGEPQWPGEGILAVDGSASLTAATPHLVSHPDGGVFVCFQVQSAIFDIRCQRLDSSGSRLWSSAGVSVTNGGDANLRALPRGVSDGAGGLLLFWRNQGPIGAASPGPMLMEGQHFAPDGQKLWGASPKVLRTTNLASDNSYTYNFFQVVSDGNGGAVLGFNDWTGTSDFALDVMAQRVSSSGDLLWGDGAVVTGANGHQQHDQTIAAGDGGAFFLIFDQVDSGHNRLLLFRLDADGAPTWEPSGILVSDSAATALDYGSYGSFDDGDLRIVWTHQNFAQTLEMDPVLATYDSSGHRKGTTVLTTAADGQFVRGLAWSHSFGGFLALWDDRRKADWDDLDVGGALVREFGACRSGLFFTIPPCRLADTRKPGGSALSDGRARSFDVSGSCGIPPSAVAVALNVTVVSPSADGHLTLFPAGHFRPVASTSNFRAGQTRASNAILGLSLGGGVSAFPAIAGAGTSHVILDVSGYFE
jgi:hypothetical protein